MPINITSALLCDQIRREDNGKLIAIGVYSGGVILPTMPGTIGFATLVRMEPESLGTHEVTIRATLSGATVAEQQGEVSIVHTRAEWTPIPLPPINITEPGQLRIEQKFGKKWTPFLIVEIVMGRIATASPQPS